MKMRNTVLSLLALPVLMGGCTVYQEGHLTENRVQVREHALVQEMELSDLNADGVAGLAHHYNKHGEGGVELTLLYDPSSRTNTAMHAAQSGARLTRGLQDNGVDAVRSNILPVQGRGDAAGVVVSYRSYTAHAPRDCGVMPGFSDTDLGHDEEYRLGCTMETLFARQVARPRDLLGRGRSADSADGKAFTNAVIAGRAGGLKDALEGQRASSE